MTIRTCKACAHRIIERRQTEKQETGGACEISKDFSSGYHAVPIPPLFRRFGFSERALKMPRGGFRPGSGRPKGSKNGKQATPAPVAPEASTPIVSTPEPIVSIDKQTPLEYLLAVMNDPEADALRRDRAASVAAPFMHARAGESGKKDERRAAAAKVATGKFAPAAPPRLVVNNK